MQYDDALYGKVEFTEALLLDLIASDAMQRLKGISQHGITALLGITPQFSRFDHSIGTMLLVRRLGAPIDEQVAALLHDVSHTASSTSFLTTTAGKATTKKRRRSSLPTPTSPQF
jgi:HD superfamily phosphohydrolase